MSCRRVLGRIFGSSFVRQMVVTLIPMAVMVALVVHINTLNHRENRTTTTQTSLVGANTMARNIVRFFDGVELVMNSMRQLVAVGSWRDPSSIAQLLDVVVPTLSTEAVFRGIVVSSTDKTYFSATMIEPGLVADTANIPEAMLTRLRSGRVVELQMNMVGDGFAPRRIRRYLKSAVAAGGFTLVDTDTYPTTGAAALPTIPNQQWWPASHTVAWLPPQQSADVSFEYGDRVSHFVRADASLNQQWSRGPQSTVTRLVVRTSAVAAMFAFLPPNSDAMLVGPDGIIIFCAGSPERQGLPTTSLGSDPLNSLSGVEEGKVSLADGRWAARRPVEEADVPGLVGGYIVVVGADISVAFASITAFARHVAALTRTPGRLAERSVIVDHHDVSQVIHKLVPMFVAARELAEAIVFCDGFGEVCVVVHDAFLPNGTVAEGFVDVEVRLDNSANMNRLVRWFKVDHRAARFNWLRRETPLTALPTEFLSPFQAASFTAMVGLDLAQQRYRAPVLGPFRSINHIHAYLGFPMCFMWPVQHGVGGSQTNLRSCATFVMSADRLRHALINMRLDSHQFGGAVVADEHGNVIVSTHHDVPDRGTKVWDLPMVNGTSANRSGANAHLISRVIPTERIFNVSIAQGRFAGSGEHNDYVVARRVYVPAFTENDLWTNSSETGHRIGAALYILVHVTEEIVFSEDIQRTVYALDGLVILVIVLFLLHALHFVHHMRGIVQIGTAMDYIAELQFDKVDYEGMSKNYHWNNDLQSMQRSTLKLYFSMRDYKSLMGAAVGEAWNPSVGRTIGDGCDAMAVGATSGVGPGGSPAPRLFSEYRAHRQIGLHAKRVILLSIALRCQRGFPAVVERLVTSMTHECGGFALRPRVIVFGDSTSTSTSDRGGGGGDASAGGPAQYIMVECTWDSTEDTRGKRCVLAWKCLRKCFEVLTGDSAASPGSPLRPARITITASSHDDVEMETRDGDTQGAEARTAWDAPNARIDSVVAVVAEGDAIVGLLGDRAQREFNLSGDLRSHVTAMQRFALASLPHSPLNPRPRMLVELAVVGAIQQELGAREQIALPIALVESQHTVGAAREGGSLIRVATICDAVLGSEKERRASVEAASACCQRILAGDVRGAAEIATSTPQAVQEADGPLWNLVHRALATTSTRVLHTVL